MPATPPPAEEQTSSPGSSRGGGSRSLLVETVSLNYEDFSDSFLTCPTCLSGYDSEQRFPKLLPCSHTVCVSCLQHIASTGYRGTFRCPICREPVALPRGGVSALAPSFVVNQLLELMSQRPKDVLPQCTEHVQQELLFCEPCDAVFCPECTPGAHEDRAGQHTVLPFSVAIKRMNEILAHKAQLCKQGLGAAARAVQQELNQLTVNESTCAEDIDRSFQELFVHLEMRRRDLQAQMRDVASAKRQELEEQLNLIRAERNKVESTCTEAQQQMEVRGVTARIAALSEQQGLCESLAEPRTNAFLRYETAHNASNVEFESVLSKFGRVRTSTTYPPHCTVDCESAVAHLMCRATITTYDFKNNKQTCGEDPVAVSLSCEGGGRAPPTRLQDNKDGTYLVTFTPVAATTLSLSVSLFGRSLRCSPLSIPVTEHISPTARWGVRGTQQEGFRQPVSVRSLPDGDLLVLDTGNSRLKRITREGSVRGIIEGPALQSQSCTGLGCAEGSIYLCNWRTRSVHTLDERGVEQSCFTHEKLQEPTAIAVSSQRELFVADNQLSQVLVFDICGKLQRSIGRRGDRAGEFWHIADVVVGLGNQLIVADSRLQVFSHQGRYLREVGRQSARGQYGGVAMDASGQLLASRSEKGACFIQVFSSNFQWLFNIDSASDKLRRASHLCVPCDEPYLYVADLGNDCVKKYRYR